MTDSIRITATPVIIDAETFKVKCAISFRDQVNEISEIVCDLKEQAIREGLIKLGWTPPEEKK